jgi:dUTPase
MVRATTTSASTVGAVGFGLDAPVGVPEIGTPEIDTGVQMAVPEPVRAMVRATTTSALTVGAVGVGSDAPVGVPEIGTPGIDTPEIDTGVQVAVPEPVRAMVRATTTNASTVGAVERRDEVTEAEINAVLQDPGYKQAGLTKGAARQIAQMKQGEGKAQREQHQGEERYHAALLSKGRQEMEGWGHSGVDKDCPMAAAGGVCVVDECTWCDERDGNGQASRGIHKLAHKLYAVERRKARPRVLQQWQAMGRVARAVTTWAPQPRPGQERGSEFSQSCNMVLWQQHGPPLPCKLVGVHKGRPVVRHH